SADACTPGPASRTRWSASCTFRLLRRAGKSTSRARAPASSVFTASRIALSVRYGPAATYASSATRTATASHAHFFMRASPCRRSVEVQVEGGAQVVDERRQGLQVLRQDLAQPRPQHDRVVDRPRSHEVAVAQVVDELELGREALRP